MAVYFDGQATFTGAVLKTEEHMWMDGMLEEHAVVWNMDSHKTELVQIGYYGIDGANLAGGWANIDATQDVISDVLRTLKHKAYRAFEKSVIEYKKEIRKGRMAEVVKGRKVAKGTVLEVFWVGEKPTYRSRSYSWMNETETIAGCYDKDGNKVWIKAEYLKPIDEIKSPDARERKKFIRDYIRNEAVRLNIRVCEGKAPEIRWYA